MPDDTITIPTELFGPTPRRVRYVKSVQIVRLKIFAAIVAVTALYIWLGNESVETVDALKYHGVTTIGKVTDYSCHKGSCFVDYEFSAEGKIVEGTHHVTQEDTYRTKSIGDRFPVRYLPNDPSIYAPSGTRECCDF